MSSPFLTANYLLSAYLARWQSFYVDNFVGVEHALILKRGSPDDLTTSLLL